METIQYIGAGERWTPTLGLAWNTGDVHAVAASDAASLCATGLWISQGDTPGQATDRPAETPSDSAQDLSIDMPEVHEDDEHPKY